MPRWRWATWLIVGWVVGAFAVSYVIARNAHPDVGANELGRLTSGVYTPLALAGLFVLLPVWVFTRRKRCPNCGGEIDPKTATCSKCGYSAAPTVPMQPGYPGQPAQPTAGMCPRCGQIVDARATSCPRCGFIPGSPPAAPSPPSEPSAPPPA